MRSGPLFFLVLAKYAFPVSPLHPLFHLKQIFGKDIEDIKLLGFFPLPLEDGQMILTDP